MATKNGTTDPDNLIGTPDNDLLDGGPGDDVLDAGTGDDVLLGGDGNDTLIGGAGQDVVQVEITQAALTWSLGMDGQLRLNGGVGTGIDQLTGVEQAQGADFSIGIVHEAFTARRVNTIAQAQMRDPNCAALKDGGYVVAWAANVAYEDFLGQTVQTWRVATQRFDSNGVPLGANRPIDVVPGEYQFWPAITGLDDGGYAVTWQSQYDIHSQRFDAQGVATGSDIDVGLTGGNGFSDSTIAALPGGGYVVVFGRWYVPQFMSGVEGSEYFGLDIYAQRYDEIGAPLGGLTLVNTDRKDGQGDPAVAILSDGSYVVTWTSSDGDTQVSKGIFAQRYNHEGHPLGGETRISTTQGVRQSEPDIAALSDGGYVVTWEATSAPTGYLTSDALGIFSQGYASDGSAMGEEIPVYLTVAESSASSPKIAALAKGGYVVVWETRNAISGLGGDSLRGGDEIYSQRFNSAGVAVGDRALVNKVMSADRQNDQPDVSALGDGGYVVTWRSIQNNAYNVSSQRFDANGLREGHLKLVGDDGGNVLRMESTFQGVELHGGDGADTLAGGGGSDVLIGGPGADSFEFFRSGSGMDRIADFQEGDELVVRGLASTGLIQKGDNAEALALGRLMVSAPSAGFTRIFIGTDTTPGADLTIELAGAFPDAVFDFRSDGMDARITYAVQALPTGTAGNDVLDGTAGNDVIAGLAGADRLRGLAGDDSLLGGPGNDTLDGGAGTDWVVHDDAVSAVSVDLGTGVSRGTDGDDSLDGIENASGTGFDDTLLGGSGNNVLRGLAGDDIIDGADGFDTADFGKAIGGVTASLTTGTATGEGHDTLSLVEALTGSSFNDVLIGNIEANALDGGGGDDTLAGSEGSDTLRGGAGNDQLEGGAGFDVLLGGVGTDILDGGEILDRIGFLDSNRASYAEASFAVVIDLVTGVVLKGMSGADTLINVNFVTGSSRDDAITGSPVLNLLEEFEGLAGNDTIDGGANAGSGENRVTYASSPAAVSVNLTTRLANDGFGDTDTLRNISYVGGSFYNDVLTGSDTTGYTESFDGRAGNDTIDGRGGLDTLRFVGANAGVNVNLATGVVTDGQGGTDTVLNIENVRGTRFDDILTGDPGDNVLEGRAGNDTLDGGAQRIIVGNSLREIWSVTGNHSSGYDTVLFSDATAGVAVMLGADGTNGTATGGGIGTDVLINIEYIIGSAYGDVIHGSDRAVNEIFRGGAGDDTIQGGSGTGVDLGFNYVDYRFSDGAVTVNLVTGVATGAAGTDSLSGMNAILGGSFNDLLIGDTGDNHFDAGGGDDTIDGGAGWDILAYTNATGGVNVNIPSGTSSGAAGNDSFSGIEAVRGSEFADTLTGSDGDDDLQGRAGNDSIDGGSGNDTLHGGYGDNVMDGGAGWDILAYTNATGGVNINMASGTSIGAAGSDTFAGIEALRGSEFADTLTGSDGDDDIQGRAGNDSIDGGAGNDTLHAGYGDDVMDGGEGADVAIFAGIRSDYTQALLSGVRLSLTSTTEGIDILSNIEILQFADMSLQLLIGKVADGYIAGATIYIDADRDGIADPEEATGIVTDAQGNFTGAFSLDAPILAIGGSNVDTGLPNRLVLAAPQGSTVITPLTTLIQSQLTLTGQSIGEAESAVQVALGLSADVDLTQYDPLAQAAGNATALAVQSAAAQVAELGARAVAEGTAFSAITGAIAAGVQAGQTIDLTDRATLDLVLGGVASSAALDEAAATNTAIAAADSIAAISTIQAIAGDETAPTVTSFTPPDAATGIAIGSNITVTFSEPIQSGSGTIVLKTTAGAVVASYPSTSPNLAFSGSTLTLNPTANLQPYTSYTVEIAAGSIQDLAGNPYAGTTSYDFTTGPRLTVGDALVSVYTGMYNRAPDQGGLSFWQQDVQNKFGLQSDSAVTDLAFQRAMVQAFAQFPTYYVLYKDMSDEAFVSQLYVNLQNRTGDAGGQAYWLGRLDGSVDGEGDGPDSREKITADFIYGTLSADYESPFFLENFDAPTLAAAQAAQDAARNKIEVAKYYTQVFGELSNYGDIVGSGHFNPNPASPTYEADARALQAWLETQAPYANSTESIAGVTSDSATVATSKALVDALYDAASSGSQQMMVSLVGVVEG